jgi:hypothetical protein
MMGDTREGQSGDRRRRTSVAVFAGAMLALTFVAGTANATLFERERYSNDYTFTNTDCGFAIDVVGHNEGIFQIRTGKGNDVGAFFAHDNYEFTEVGTRRDTRVSIRLSGNGLFQETRATRVSGTVFEFTSINAGQPFTVRDSDGNIILRDRGVIHETILFDTLGDDTPGGDFIEQVSFSFSGPHPGVDFDLCTLFE